MINFHSKNLLEMLKIIFQVMRIKERLKMLQEQLKIYSDNFENTFMRIKLYD